MYVKLRREVNDSVCVKLLLLNRLLKVEDLTVAAGGLWVHEAPPLSCRHCWAAMGISEEKGHVLVVGVVSSLPVRRDLQFALEETKHLCSSDLPNFHRQPLIRTGAGKWGN